MSSPLIRVVAPLLRGSRASLTPRAGITSMPPKGKVSGVETVIGLTAFVCAFMIPSGWILSNLEFYKKK